MYITSGDDYYLQLLENIITYLQSIDMSIIDMLFEIALDDNDLLTLDILMTSLLQPEYPISHEIGS